MWTDLQSDDLSARNEDRVARLEKITPNIPSEDNWKWFLWDGVDRTLAESCVGHLRKPKIRRWDRFCHWSHGQRSAF